MTLRREGGYAVLTVQDSGIGIPQSDIGHLFTEFFRASNARAGRTPGTGLGLAAVKALAALLRHRAKELNEKRKENQS